MKEFRFDEKNHKYYLGDKELPSVTTIISHVYNNYKNVDPEVLKMAGLRGSVIHEAIEKEDPMGMFASWEPYYNAYLKFKEDFHYLFDKNIQKEVRVHNGKFAGTIDFVSGDTLIDWKTSKNQLEQHQIQLFAYSKLIDRDINYLLLVYLKPNGLYQTVLVEKEKMKRKWKHLYKQYLDDINKEGVD